MLDFSSLSPYIFYPRHNPNRDAETHATETTLMHDYPHELKSLPKRHDFLICIDSDGTVFDTMETKHRCFRDCLIRHFGWQGHDADLAAEVWAFVNLHSIHRGENRFRSLLLTLDMLRGRGVPVPEMPHLRAWTATETKLGNPALLALQEHDFSEEMELVLRWSRESDEAIAATVRNPELFPGVREALARAFRAADVMVVSHTPCKTLAREWTAHGIDRDTIYLAGQECGSKTEHIRYVSEGKYMPGHVLMIGDSPGDLAAARLNHAWFFPIVPGHETESWKKLSEEGLERFFGEKFDSSYQESVLGGFQTALPAIPPWEKPSRK